MVRKGSSFESFLEEQGIVEEVTAEAKKRVLIWQLKKLLQESNLTMTELAARMGTSRSSVNRMFDPSAGLTLETLTKAANALDAIVSISITPKKAATKKRKLSDRTRKPVKKPETSEAKTNRKGTRKKGQKKAGQRKALVG